MQAPCCGGETTPKEKAQQHQIQAKVAAQISEAKRHANIYRPPEGISMWASAKEIGCHFGVGMGLYFQMLEWLMILFSCLTFLSFPFWIVINQSVFTDEANKDNESVGLQVFEKPSLLATTFASIPDHQLDPNNTLVYMNTELGASWYGPMKKDDFLLWISLLDVVGVVLTIFLVTYYTWKAGWFELSVDRNTYDATDYAVLVTGLPPDAGFHEVGHFFSKFGEVIDVTLVLDMGRVLQACAKASRLEHKREQLASIRRLFPEESGRGTQEQLEQTEEQLVMLLKDINEDMDRAVAERQHPLSGSAILRHPSNLIRPEKWGTLPRRQHNPAHTADAESGEHQPKPSLEAEGEEVDLEGKDAPEEWDGRADKEFTKKAVYDTKAAFVTFNRMSEAKNCLKLTPNPGWIGWLYRHTVAPDAQCIRGHCIDTVRARNPTDYIFENMCFSGVLRLWHKFGIWCLYLFLLIVCALIVSGLSSRTRVDLDRTDLDFSNGAIGKDIGRAASYLPQSAPPGSTVSQLRGLYEEAMQEVSSSATTPAFSPKLASKANFTDYCKLALPDVCAEHYRQSLGGAQEVELNMTFGKQLQWGKDFDEVVYERPLLNSLNKMAETGDPRAVEGTDVGLSACLACYCLGLSAEAKQSEQKPGDWLLVSQQHCGTYIAGDEDAGTEAGISVVIAVLNIVLKLFVQFLAAAEKQWTRSEMEKSFCVVAYTSQLLNSVLVVLLVNARPNAKTTETGERVNDDDIGGLKYIILGGSFDDFSAAWYQYVGTSFMILLFIQTIFPLVNICIEVILKGVQRIIVRLKREATQDAFDSAYMFPCFLLQQRIADVMLNVSVAMLFYSGMPLCAAVVILVFGVASIMDRWAITHLMTVCRYGSELPRLILGLIPWMVFLHCGFGLWQHSFFMMQNWDREATSVFVQAGKDQLEHDIRPEDAFGEYIDERNVKTRISQPNSFGLLLLAFIMFLWLFFRHVIQQWLDPIVRLWIDGKMQENAKGGDDDDNRRFWLLRKMLAMPKFHLPGMPDTPEDDDCMTFERAIAEKRLKGMPTFRLPFHPRYADAFSGLLHSAIWSRMLGPYRYTRLVPVREEEPLTVYRVEVKTSDIWGAGTDADVLIQIFGIKDGKEVSTGLHELSSMHNNFERGNTDVFLLTLRDVGRMERIEIRSCSKGFFAYWHLEFVRIKDCVRGVTQMFRCGKWLDPRYPESLVQVLTPDGGAPNQHRAIQVADERVGEDAALLPEQNGAKGACENGAQGTMLPEATLEGGCDKQEQHAALSSSLGTPPSESLPKYPSIPPVGGVILEEDGAEEMQTTGTMSLVEGVEGMDREVRGKCQVGSSSSSKESIHIEMCPQGPGLPAGAGGCLVPDSLPTSSGNKCDTLKRQRQERLVQIKLSWKVSDTLILHAKDALLDENYGDFKQFEYGPALSNYLASMQAPQSQHIEASSRCMKT